MPDATEDFLHTSPVHLLHMASQGAEELFARNVAHGFTARQFAVLTAVAESAGLSQTAIVNATGIDRSTVAEMVRRLARKGLLQRRRTKSDERAYAVRLTPTGEKILQGAEASARKTDDAILAVLPPAKRAFVLDALMKIIENGPAPISATVRR